MIGKKYEDNHKMSGHGLPPPGSIMLIHKIARGGMVYDTELACAIGALLLRRHYSAEELARQQPLSATDHGDIWRVEGSWNRDYGLENEGGPFFMTIAKFDGQITDFGLWGPKLKGGSPITPG